jgi:hypothetical protein
MEPSSSTQKGLSPKPVPTELSELTRIREHLAALLAHAQQHGEQQKQISRHLSDVARLLEGFTSGGSSFQAYQVSPLVLVYAAILGPILGDRIDGALPKEGDYLDEMTKGAAVMARQLLRTLDAYQGERGVIDYLEANCGDIKPPDQASASG